MKAREKFEQIKIWIDENSCLHNLKNWWVSLNEGWDTLRITSGIHVQVKKRAYGHKNMAYFKLKILQGCGYFKFKWVPMRH